jgi:hypothetical protein
MSSPDSIAWNIIDKYFKDNPYNLVAHHLDSYNDFFNKEYSWYEVVKILNKYYHNTLLINKEYTSIETKNLYINTYDNL